VAMLDIRDVQKMGFRRIGKNPLISDRASFYGISDISLGDNVRIDDFCVLAAGSGGIYLGDHVHIAIYSSLIGAGKITLSDFSGLSSRVSVYSSSDDYSGASLTNPTVPAEFKNAITAEVFLGRHVIIGSGSVILPGVTLEDGVAVGALSLVARNCEAFSIYAGNPAKKIKDRSRDLLQMESALKSSRSSSVG